MIFSEPEVIYRLYKTSENFFPERRKFLSLVGLGMSGVLSALFIDGITLENTAIK
jgi:hypothetical protein